MPIPATLLFPLACRRLSPGVPPIVMPQGNETQLNCTPFARNWALAPKGRTAGCIYRAGTRKRDVWRRQLCSTMRARVGISALPVLPLGTCGRVARFDTPGVKARHNRKRRQYLGTTPLRALSGGRYGRAWPPLGQKGRIACVFLDEQGANGVFAGASMRRTTEGAARGK